MNAPFYNQWGVMHPYLQILSAVLFLAVVGGLSWFAADMRSILKSGQRKQQLSIAGDWKGLEDYYESAARSRRPFVWLHRKYLIPGNLETQHALFLYEQGRLDEALSKVDYAIQRNKSKPWIFRSFHAATTFKSLCGALRTRALVLTAFGRYDEARGAAAEVENLAGAKGQANSVLALLEYDCGHIDEALRLAQAVRPEDSQFDSMRTVMAYCYLMKGDFEQAIQMRSIAPAADITRFYSASGLHAMTKSPEATELLELQRRRLTGVFPPIRLIVLAQIYIAMEDFANADRMLDQAEKCMGPQPALQASYCRQRATSFAGQGNDREAENHLERMRAIVKKECPRRSLHWETRFTAGRVYLYLKRFNEALAELDEAQKLVLHPIEKHSTAYWLAKTHESFGNQSEALRFYEIVAADSIPSWMCRQAAEVLAASR